MSRLVAIGEGELLDGLQLCGVELVRPQAPGDAAAAMRSRPDAEVLILTSKAASELRELIESRRMLHVEIPE